ncbi:hypothetical protein QN277_019888 [Acacia crassicarpa]|uniref:Uncharacterized protein n=1 Tax=Acacia crassicarpa TaxID=499986 RepID=A0AAE1JIF4_9FABA|nr:hypothetical protein QN277_019888 [Acacia crassicarpa]
MDPRPNPRLFPSLPLSHSSLLPLSHLPPPSPPSPSSETSHSPINVRRPQPHPPPPLLHHGPWMYPYHYLPYASPPLDHLLPAQNPSLRTSLLLGLRLLPLEDSRTRRHSPHHRRELHPTAHVPPRVPPRDGPHHVLPVAPDLPVLVPSGARDEHVRARAHVRVLLVERLGDPTQVEAGGDGLPDRAVFVQLRGVGCDAVLPFRRIRMLRVHGLVLQCGI